MSCQFQAQIAPVPALHTEKHIQTITEVSALIMAKVIFPWFCE